MAKKKKRYVRRRHFVFVKVANFLIAPVLRRKIGYRTRKINVKKYEPFVVVSNHVSAFDPILVTGTFDRQVYYLSSELIFSKGFISRVLEYTFAPIPKSKGQADISGVRTMMQVVKEGGNIGVFVEGNSTITGALSEVPSGMGKLVKMLKRPLVIFNFHGGYLSNPRWSIGKRKRRHVTGTVKQILTYDDYKEMSADEINELIVDGINVNAYDEEDPLGYPGKHNAEGIHRLVFMCPQCASHNTLYGHGNTVTCKNCDFKGEYDKHGYLHSSTFKTAQNMVELDKMSKMALQDYIINTRDFTLSEVGHFSEVFRRRRKHFGEARVTLSRAGLNIEFSRHKHTDIFYPFDQIDSMVMQQKEVLVMYIKGEPAKMINIKNTNQTSAYHFLIALQILQNIMQQGDKKTIKKLTSAEIGLK